MQSQKAYGKDDIKNDQEVTSTFEELSNAHNKIFRDSGILFQDNNNFFRNSHSFYSSRLSADDKQYTYTITVPGYDKEEIKIEMLGEYITVSAQKQKKEADKKDVALEENSAFYQKILLPKDTNKDKISSTLKNGILTITIDKSPSPKKEEAKIVPIN